MTDERVASGAARAPRSGGRGRATRHAAPTSRAMLASMSLAATATIVAALALSAQHTAPTGPPKVELDTTSGATAARVGTVAAGAATSPAVPASDVTGPTIPSAAAPPSGSGSSSSAVAVAAVPTAPAPSGATAATAPPTTSAPTTVVTAPRATTTTTAARTRAS